MSTDRFSAGPNPELDLGAVGLWHGRVDAAPTSEVNEAAHELEELGFRSLWLAEAVGRDPFVSAANILSATKTLKVATGIANIYARDATAAVMGHNSLNRLYDGRFVLGLGVSHAPLVADMRGHEYQKPIATMRAYLDRMDQAWTAFGGAPEVKQVVLAALGPQMSKLSAERTLGAFPYNITPQQASLSRTAMGGKGAVICEQKICLTTDPVVARKVAREALGFYMGLPNYVNNWFRLGFEQSDLADGGSERLLDAMVAWGSADQIKARLAEYFARGADQVVLQPLRPDGQPGPDYKALEALAPGA